MTIQPVTQPVTINLANHPTDSQIAPTGKNSLSNGAESEFHSLMTSNPAHINPEQKVLSYIQTANSDLNKKMGSVDATNISPSSLVKSQL